MMNTLNYNDIIFDEEEHSYINGVGYIFSGITSVISTMLFPDKYDGIPASVLDKAAAHGSFVHEQLQLFDMFGTAEQCEELTNYNELKQRLTIIPLANEYLVSDGANYATKIDMVDTRFNLYDFKTTSKLDLEYIRWQLSICAYMFEFQNSHLKAGKLYAIWLRNNKAELHEVQRISSALVLDLLDCHLSGLPFMSPIPEVTESTDVQQAIDAERLIARLDQQLKQAKALRGEILERIKQDMTHNSCSILESDNVKITITKPYTKTSLDTARIKDERPELYAEFSKTTEVEESIKITLKKKKK